MKSINDINSHFRGGKFFETKYVEKKSQFSGGKLFETKETMIGRYIIIVDEAKKADRLGLDKIIDKIEMKNTKVLPSLKILKEGVEFMYEAYKNLFLKYDEFFANGNVCNTSSAFEIIPSKDSQAGNVSIGVNQLATKDQIVGSVSFGDTTSQLDFPSGNLIINNLDIQLITGSTLEEIVTTINSSSANVLASIIQPNVGQFEILITSNNQGSPITITDDQDLQILAYFGISQSAATSASLSAQITINGVAYTRPSNNITDLDGVLLSGATINLKETTQNPVVVKVLQNYDAGVKLFQDFAKKL